MSRPTVNFNLWITVSALFFSLFYFPLKAFSLDAATAHPWIAEYAALIWPWTINEQGLAVCSSPALEQACNEIKPSLAFGPAGGQCLAENECFLGQFNPTTDSGGFTDRCEVGKEISFPDTLRACTGKRIVEGSIEEDMNPLAGIVAFGHSYNPDKTEGENRWTPLSDEPLFAAKMAAVVTALLTVGVALESETAAELLKNLPFYVLNQSRTALAGAQIGSWGQVFNLAILF